MNLEATKTAMLAIVEQFRNGKLAYDDAVAAIERIESAFRHTIDLLTVEGSERLSSRMRKLRPVRHHSSRDRAGLIAKLIEVKKVALFSLDDARKANPPPAPQL